MITVLQLLIKLLGLVYEPTAFFSSQRLALKKKQNNCNNCGGSGYIELPILNTFSFDTYSFPCVPCSVLVANIEMIDYMLSYKYDPSLSREEVFIERLYELFLTRWFGKSYDRTPSRLEFELYMWFLLCNSCINSWVKCNPSYREIISMYVAEGYSIRDILLCVDKITTVEEISYSNDYFKKTERGLFLFVDLRTIPGLSDLLRKKIFRRNSWQIWALSSPTIVSSYSILPDLQNCLSKVDIIDFVICDRIRPIIKLRKFCEMIGLDVDISNLLFVMQLVRDNSLEDSYLSEYVSFEEMKKAHNDQTTILVALGNLFLDKTPLNRLVSDMDLNDGLFGTLVYIRYQYDDFCSRYYVGHSERLSHDDLFDVYTIMRTHGSKTFTSENLKKAFIAVLDLYDDFTVEVQFNRNRFSFVDY